MSRLKNPAFATIMSRIEALTPFPKRHPSAAAESQRDFRGATRASGREAPLDRQPEKTRWNVENGSPRRA